MPVPYICAYDMSQSIGSGVAGWMEHRHFTVNQIAVDTGIEHGTFTHRFTHTLAKLESCVATRSTSGTTSLSWFVENCSHIGIQVLGSGYRSSR